MMAEMAHEGAEVPFGAQVGHVESDEPAMMTTDVGVLDVDVSRVAEGESAVAVGGVVGREGVPRTVQLARGGFVLFPAKADGG